MYCAEEFFLDDDNEIYWEIAMQSIEVVSDDKWVKIVHENRDYMKFDYAFGFINKTDSVDDIVIIRTFIGNAFYENGAGNTEMCKYHMNEACDYIQTTYN
jgi:hypothetical protein